MSRWWTDAVVEEVYVRSFADGDGDGVGDLPGVLSRLDHLASLGVDAVWLTPFYPGPGRDHGYDVTDHRAVDPSAGTLADVDALVAAAHDRGLRVLVDLVLNHTSSDHPWFRAAASSGPGSPERARYVVRRGSGPDGERAPVDWPSVFGGAAWEPFGDGDWYLHLFDATQPDLDHAHPDVRADVEETVRFWVRRGVDGLRLDVAGAYVKDDALPALPDGWVPGDPAPWTAQPAVHDVHRAIVRTAGDEAASHGAPQPLVVGEIWGPPAEVAHYHRARALHQVFAMDPVFWPFSADAAGDWRRGLEGYLDAARLGGVRPAWVHGNHDVARAASRWGRDGARAVLMLLLALPGAVYLYAGDELGLPEADLPDDALRDPTFVRSGGAERGRDGCRVPLPWTTDPPSYGFSPAGASPAWLPQPAGWDRFAVAEQERDPLSALAFTRTVVHEARATWRQAPADVTWVPAPDGTLVFRRGDLLCGVNLGDVATQAEVPDGAAGGHESVPLRPRSAAWWRRARGPGRDRPPQVRPGRGARR